MEEGGRERVVASLESEKCIDTVGPSNWAKMSPFEGIQIQQAGES